MSIVYIRNMLKFRLNIFFHFHVDFTFQCKYSLNCRPIFTITLNDGKIGIAVQFQNDF